LEPYISVVGTAQADEYCNVQGVVKAKKLTASHWLLSSVFLLTPLWAWRIFRCFAIVQD